MKNPPLHIQRIETGVRNLDALLSGGLPKGSVFVFGGSPGAGKTILAQQICFHHASATQRVIFFNTLSEPTAKTLLHLSQFSFFDRAKVDAGEIQFIDLGVILRSKGLAGAIKLILQHVKKLKPAVIAIDSFKVFDDLARSREEQRKFCYELAIQLMAWETTAILLGEYGPSDMASNVMFSIVDGLVLLSQRERSGEQQRLIQIIKMRGIHHSRDEHAFRISTDGLEVFAPDVTIQRTARADHIPTARLQSGIPKLDELLGEGIPRGSSLLVAGASGTGKTALLLEFLYRGARAGEPGILFSFEETEERLRATACGLGWDLDAEIARGMVEIVFIPQPDILVDGDMLMMKERIEALDAKRVAIDSVSVFLYKIETLSSVRTKVFQLATIVQSVGAVGLFAADIPYGTTQLSRCGVEETVVDGIILLSAIEEGTERQRYLEVYKLRNTAHVTGRHKMLIRAGGITILPRDDAAAAPAKTRPKKRGHAKPRRRS
jgi:circadian clock protein KaiC